MGSVVGVGVVVVGAGIAGVACAGVLRDAGVAVRVLERSATVGGRMASPPLWGRPVDLGAAYFTVRDDGFAAVVDDWRARGLARTWTDTPTVLADTGRSSAPGPMRWAAPRGLRSLVVDLAAGLDVVVEHPVRHVGPGPVVDGEPADAVVVAMPDPQAERLLDPGSPAAGRRWTPVLAVAAEWARRAWDPFATAFVNDHPLLTGVTDDGDRRGDGAAVLVAHTGADGADADPGAVVAAVRDLLAITDEPLAVHPHRWGLASPAEPREEPFHLGDDGVALCGDGWGSPRIETAWHSGHLLGEALVQRLA